MLIRADKTSQRSNIHADMHASGIRTRDPNVRAGEHCDPLCTKLTMLLSKENPAVLCSERVGVSLDSTVATKETVLQVCLWSGESPILTLSRCGLFNLIFCAVEDSAQGDGKVGAVVTAVWVWVTDKCGGRGGSDVTFHSEAKSSSLLHI
jgi:hypothetical protein